MNDHPNEPSEIVSIVVGHIVSTAPHLAWAASDLTDVFTQMGDAKVVELVHLAQTDKAPS